jgi:transcriptional regulator with XRE-family HTH domain
VTSLRTERTLLWDRHAFADLCRESQKSLPDIAALAGLRAPTLYAYRQGRGAPSAAALGRLAVALDCKVDDFYTWSDV